MKTKTLVLGHTEIALMLIGVFCFGVVCGLLGSDDARTTATVVMFAVGGFGGVVAAIGSAVINHPDFMDYL